MTNIENNLRTHNIKIPKANKPVANYSPYIKTDNLIFISGQIPLVDDKILFTGKVSKDLEMASAIKAAELCMLNSFAILNNALENNLNLVRKCLKINVFINSTENFYDQPTVADGASDFIKTVMNPFGDHARSAVSVNSLPKNATVEIDSVFEISID